MAWAGMELRAQHPPVGLQFSEHRDLPAQRRQKCGQGSLTSATRSEEGWVFAGLGQARTSHQTEGPTRCHGTDQRDGQARHPLDPCHPPSLEEEHLQ